MNDLPKRGKTRPDPHRIVDNPRLDVGLRRAMTRFDAACQAYAMRGSYDDFNRREAVEIEYENARSTLESTIHRRLEDASYDDL